MSSPIAIGAIGGSGTRVVAQILSQAGVHIGQELNRANDNLWFTFFLKRPRWMTHFPDPSHIRTAVSLFARASTTGLRDTATPADAALIDQIAQDLAISPRAMGVGPDCAGRILSSGPAPRLPGGMWGWKEPNSHIFLPQMAQTLPGLKYIHIIRNGFDMAFSTNTQQARNWSARITGTPLDNDPITAGQLLDYWIAANQQAISCGHMLLGDRFHVINYDDLCLDPAGTLEKLFAFLGVPASLPQMVGLIKPRSRDRYKTYGLGGFSGSQKEAVRILMAAAQTPPAASHTNRSTEPRTQT